MTLFFYNFDEDTLHIQKRHTCCIILSGSNDQDSLMNTERMRGALLYI